MKKLLLVIFYFIVSFIPTIIMIVCSLIGNLLAYITDDLVNVVGFLNSVFGKTFVVWTISLLILFVCHILMDNAKNFHFITDIIMNKVFNPFTQWVEVHYEKA